VTQSFSVMVGTTATPLVAQNWVNRVALPFATQAAAFSVTEAMLGLTVPYSAAAGGVVTIPQGLTPVIGVSLLFGQAGPGAVTVVGGSGVTVTGQLSTLGPNHVLQAVQTSQDNWSVLTYSWKLSQFMGNPNGQPLLVAYGEITFTNESAVPMLVDPDPEVAWGGDGTLISAGEVFSHHYGNGPADLWYGVVQATPAVLTVTTGPPSGFGW
jgi:hypothetical protein